MSNKITFAWWLAGGKRSTKKTVNTDIYFIKERRIAESVLLNKLEAEQS